MSEREDNVYKAKLAEQAERYDGKWYFYCICTGGAKIPQSRQSIAGACWIDLCRQPRFCYATQRFCFRFYCIPAHAFLTWGKKEPENFMFDDDDDVVAVVSVLSIVAPESLSSPETQKVHFDWFVGAGAGGLAKLSWADFKQIWHFCVARKGCFTPVWLRQLLTLLVYSLRFCLCLFNCFEGFLKWETSIVNHVSILWNRLFGKEIKHHFLFLLSCNNSFYLKFFEMMRIFITKPIFLQITGGGKQKNVWVPDLMPWNWRKYVHGILFLVLT